MKRLALLLLFAAPAFAASKSQILSARSAHHDLRVERSVVSADRIGYDVTVVDLDSGKTVMSSHVSGKPGEALDVNGDANGQQIRVHLAYSEQFFSATLNVIGGKTIVDELRSSWPIDAPGALRVGGDVKAPVVVRRVNPKYPEEARRTHVTGIVVLQVLIGKDGYVKHVEVLKPLMFLLDQSAIDAVRQWQFRPGTLDGKPVDVVFDLTIQFRT